MKSPPELAIAFRARGLKVTPQRECIFGVLHGSDVHPTAEAVYALAQERMPMMSLKTVYQTLNDLAQMGEIQQLDVGTGASRFDPNVDQHHHLVCRVCGKIRDLHVEYPELDVPLSEQQGFAIEDAEVVFRGVCAQCVP